MSSKVVFLRGINVSGHRKVPMAELRAALADAGLGEVRTYIQTGNVLVDEAIDDDVVQSTFDRVLLERFGLDDVPVVVRSQTSLAHALDVSEQQFPAPADDDGDHAKFTHVMFFSAKPAPARRAALDPDEFTPDRFALDLHGANADLHVSYAAGVSGSKLLVDRVERGFGVRATARNVNTVRRLVAMSG